MVHDFDAIWKDIIQWQGDIHKQDDALKRKKPIRTQNLPPVRRFTELIMDEGLKPVGLETLQHSPKATSTTEAMAASSAKSTGTPAKRAQEEKEKGNAFFQRKEYTKAIVHYSQAIDLDPSVAVYFVNRAMAYLKLNRYLEAERDCTRGLQLQPKNVKALWRRGIALRELGRVEEARKDFEVALALEPGNQAVKEELGKLPPLKSSGKTSATGTTVSKEIKMQEQAVEPTAATRKQLPIKVLDEAYVPGQSGITETTESRKKTNEGNDIEKQAIAPATSKFPVKELTKEKPTPAKPSAAPAATTLPIASPEKSLPSKVTSTGPSGWKPVCPATSFEFQRDWKTCKYRGDEALYQYLQCIPPSSYSKTFGSSLESDQFEKILDILDRFYTREKSASDIFEVLQGLSRVRRVDMLVMFLPPSQTKGKRGIAIQPKAYVVTKRDVQ
ncbi:uncharacterized protein BYT42DRAFT_190123 [Radiomyces spectabilis]|uniref:uncharacterized protein n=1 Tax=Radiomyces spectabilis TaxID=64574 RepID=UPI0022208CB6|nr:uncharacterized protein BYT42DRAFT_190123 [Radiomyces spectabilis]KAI8391321.1 hypothetical protein BYT42DRAFT_190123 [Radiomyces spectabilis]